METKDEPPDILIQFIIIALGAIAWLWVGWWIYHTWLIKPPEGQIKRDKSEFILVGDSLKASVPHIHISPRTLGIMTAGVEYDRIALLEKLWFCEASYKHDGVWGDSGRAYGAFQFWQSTWNHYCDGDRTDFESQIRCAEYIIFELGQGPRHWVNCWRKHNLNSLLN